MFCAAFSFAQKSPEENFKLLQNAAVPDIKGFTAQADALKVNNNYYTVFMTRLSTSTAKNFDQAFSDFTGRNDEHKKAYFKIMKDYLVQQAETSNVKDDITFMDQEEFKSKFITEKEYIPYDFYKDAMHKTTNVIDNVKLVMIRKWRVDQDDEYGMITSISVISPQGLLPVGEEELYMHEWNIVHLCEPKGVVETKVVETRLVSANVSPKDINIGLKDSLKKAGFNFINYTLPVH